MPETLEDLIARTRGITMTAEQLRKQRQSFAYGNTRIGNQAITREMIAEEDRKLQIDAK
jgi:hypothetical protein